mmetsp:Transcript_47499/g.152525  ORF Transcript_47499/g.152525 Transcript_47499/m.152525 type:complete len:287 (+) Transcript_47499:1891-2751(+)
MRRSVSVPFVARAAAKPSLRLEKRSRNCSASALASPSRRSRLSVAACIWLLSRCSRSPQPCSPPKAARSLRMRSSPPALSRSRRAATSWLDFSKLARNSPIASSAARMLSLVCSCFFARLWSSSVEPSSLCKELALSSSSLPSESAEACSRSCRSFSASPSLRWRLPRSSSNSSRAASSSPRRRSSSRRAASAASRAARLTACSSASCDNSCCSFWTSNWHSEKSPAPADGDEGPSHASASPSRWRAELISARRAASSSSKVPLAASASSLASVAASSWSSSSSHF